MRDGRTDGRTTEEANGSWRLSFAILPVSCWKISFVAIYTVLLQNNFVALLRGEKLSQKLCRWRKMTNMRCVQKMKCFPLDRSYYRLFFLSGERLTAHQQTSIHYQQSRVEQVERKKQIQRKDTQHTGQRLGNSTCCNIGVNISERNILTGDTASLAQNSTKISEIISDSILLNFSSSFDKSICPNCQLYF